MSDNLPLWKQLELQGAIAKTHSCDSNSELAKKKEMNETEQLDFVVIRVRSKTREKLRELSAKEFLQTREHRSLASILDDLISAELKRY